MLKLQTNQGTCAAATGSGFWLMVGWSCTAGTFLLNRMELTVNRTESYLIKPGDGKAY
ncbi:MAG: hypothetical protein ACLVEJ_04875 [Parabacteroides sp.]